MTPNELILRTIVEWMNLMYFAEASLPDGVTAQLYRGRLDLKAKSQPVKAR